MELLTKYINNNDLECSTRNIHLYPASTDFENGSANALMQLAETVHKRIESDKIRKIIQDKQVAKMI